MGGNVMAHSSRESIMYQAAVFHNHVPDTLHLLSSIVRNPLLLDAELDDVRTSSSYELNDMVHRPDMTVPELLHATAYRDIRNTIPSPSSAASPYPVTSLGRPMHCTLDRLSNVTPDILRAYRSTWFTPDRLVVASVGIPHTQFVEMVCKHFEDMPALLAESHAARQNCIDDIKYSGGVSIVDTSSMPPSPNPDDMPLTHVNIAFESLAMSDPDIYALATLASLLGGGGSFSGNEAKKTSERGRHG